MKRRAILSVVGDPPTNKALDLAAVKARLRGFEAADPTDDAALTSIINAVHDHLDGDRGTLGRSFISTTYDEKFEGWPECREPLRLALAPVSEIVSVTYRDSAGAEQTLSADDYEFTSDGDAGVIRALDAWPALDVRRMTPITVRYIAGYGETWEAIPAALVEAMTLVVGQLFEYRDALGADALAEALRSDPLIAQYDRAAN